MAEALRELREWQRAQAGKQDKSLRAAKRSWERLGKLDEERAATVEALGDSVGELVELGLDRERVAGFLDVSLEEMTRTLAGRRNGRSRADGNAST